MRSAAITLEPAPLTSRSGYRTVRYGSGRSSLSHTADSHSLNKFRIKRNSLFEGAQSRTTAVCTDNAEECFLMSNFKSMMDSHQKAFFSERTQAIKGHPRMTIVDFRELNESDFTTLDVFSKPHDNIQIMAKTAQKQLREQTREVSVLRAQIQMLSKSLGNELSNFHAKTKEAIDAARGCIHKNEVQQHERKYKMKREIAELEQNHLVQEDLVQSLHERSLRLQEFIFNSTPLELMMNHESELPECNYV